MFTTLNKLKAHNACEERYNHLLQCLGKTQADDELLSIRTILEYNGIEDAIWAIRTVEGYDKEMRLFACDCAESALSRYEAKYPNDDRPRKAIEVARRYANGEATLEELDAARKEAWAKWEATNWESEVAAAWIVLSRVAWWTASWAPFEEAHEKQKEILLKHI